MIAVKWSSHQIRWVAPKPDSSARGHRPFASHHRLLVLPETECLGANQSAYRQVYLFEKHVGSPEIVRAMDR